MNRQFDVTVRGAGIFGLACGWEMARRGARVRVIETQGLGAGSSGGLVGALAPHVPENWNPKKAFQLDSLLRAEAFWAEVAACSGQDPGYARRGRLQPIADDQALALAQARAISAEALWQGQARWQVTALAGDAYRPATPTGLWIYDDLTARLSPRLAAQALAGAITALGGAICLGAAGGIGPEDPPHPVLHATGAQGLRDLAAFAESAGLRAPGARALGAPIKGQAAAFRPAIDCRDLPQLFIAGLHVVPHADGSLAMGSTSEQVFDAPDSTDDQLEALIARARAACPALAEAPVIARWAGLRPRARSRAPMLGPWPGRPGHFIANGGFKIGFGMAPGVAAVMADLILAGQDRIPQGFRVADSF